MMEDILKHLIDIPFKTAKSLSQVTLLHVIIMMIALYFILALLCVIIGLRTYRQRRLMDKSVMLQEIFVQKIP